MSLPQNELAPGGFVLEDQDIPGETVASVDDLVLAFIGRRELDDGDAIRKDDVTGPHKWQYFEAIDVFASLGGDHHSQGLVHDGENGVGEEIGVELLDDGQSMNIGLIRSHVHED